MARHENGQFQKGTGGRPAGSRNKLQGKFIEALAKDFDEHGEAVIRLVRADRPDVYLKIIASILPKEFLVGNTPTDDMTDDEIKDALALVRKAREAAAVQ